MSNRSSTRKCLGKLYVLVSQDTLAVTGSRAQVLCGNSPGIPTGADFRLQLRWKPASDRHVRSTVFPQEAAPDRHVGSTRVAVRRHTEDRRAPTLTICPGISTLRPSAQE
jgi:hypothetical protein